MPLIWLMSRPDTVPSRGKAFSRKLRVALVAAGLTEAKSCSLVESGACALLHVEPAVPDINIFSARNPLLDLQCAVLGSDVGTFTASIRQVALFTEVVKCTPADKYRVRAEAQQRTEAQQPGGNGNHNNAHPHARRDQNRGRASKPTPGSPSLKAHQP